MYKEDVDLRSDHPLLILTC